MLDSVKDVAVDSAGFARPLNGAPLRTRQRTIKSAIHCSGIGLHSGERISLILHPADEDSGIIFRLTGKQGMDALIPARFDRVLDTRMCTRIGNGSGASVGTVEHLIAALAGCGVDNVIVELNGNEVPIMDGSSEPFVFLIECAGLAEQSSSRRAIRVRRPVRVNEGNRQAVLEPGDNFSAEVGIDFDSQLIGRQSISLEVTEANFRSEVARARTFGFLDEVEQLRSMGLALGGSLENAVVVNGDHVVNEEGLRYRDEFVRHKLLDCIGDLYLAGAPILGHFSTQRAGHCINNHLLRALFADEANWEIIAIEDLEQAVELPVAANA